MAPVSAHQKDLTFSHMVDWSRGLMPTAVAIPALTFDECSNIHISQNRTASSLQCVNPIFLTLTQPWLEEAPIKELWGAQKSFTMKHANAGSVKAANVRAERHGRSMSGRAAMKGSDDDRSDSPTPRDGGRR